MQQQQNENVLKHGKQRGRVVSARIKLANLKYKRRKPEEEETSW